LFFGIFVIFCPKLLNLYNGIQEVSGSVPLKYQENFCFQFIRKLVLDEYCKRLNRLPWEYIEIDSDYIELGEVDYG